MKFNWLLELVRRMNDWNELGHHHAHQPVVGCRARYFNLDFVRKKNRGARPLLNLLSQNNLVNGNKKYIIAKNSFSIKR